MFEEVRIRERKSAKHGKTYEYRFETAPVGGERKWLSIIDLIMAISFVLYIAYNKCPRYRLLYLIGILKLLGDMFAWRYYGHKELINIIGSFVLVCNIAYMIILVFKDIQNISGNKSFHYNQFDR